MKQRWGLILVVAIVSFLSGGYLLRRVQNRTALGGSELLETVMQYMNKYYVDSLPTDSVYALAAAGVVKQLHDPYSSLEIDEDYKALNEITTGNYGGLGLQIDVRQGWITVVAPLPQTPAERAGIEAGDQIQEVNGKSTQGISQDKAVKTLRGDVGTKVELNRSRSPLCGRGFTVVRLSLARCWIPRSATSRSPPSATARPQSYAVKSTRC